MNDELNKRIPFVDWIRATACFMVMLVHSAEHLYGVVTEKAIESIPGGAEKLAGFATNTGGLAGDKAVLLNEANRFWVSFDKVVEVMRQTGHDLPSLYKETAEGGLAKDYKQM